MQQDSESEAESVGRQFGEMMRVHREERGLSQRQLAEHLEALHLHLDPSAITRIERGTREVKLTEALVISDFLEFPLDNIATTAYSQFQIASQNLVIFATQARKTLLQAIRYIDRWANNMDDETEDQLMEIRGRKDLVDLYTSHLLHSPAFQYGGYLGRIPEMSEGDNYALYYSDVDRSIKQQVVNAVTAHILVSEDEFVEFTKLPHKERTPPPTRPGVTDAEA